MRLKLSLLVVMVFLLGCGSCDAPQSAENQNGQQLFSKARYGEAELKEIDQWDGLIQNRIIYADDDLLLTEMIAYDLIFAYEVFLPEYIDSIHLWLEVYENGTQTHHIDAGYKYFSKEFNPLSGELIVVSAQRSREYGLETWSFYNFTNDQAKFQTNWPEGEAVNYSLFQSAPISPYEVSATNDQNLILGYQIVLTGEEEISHPEHAELVEGLNNNPDEEIAKYDLVYLLKGNFQDKVKYYQP